MISLYSVYGPDHPPTFVDVLGLLGAAALAYAFLWWRYRRPHRH